ncbi:alpha/beta hydrolase family protein [Roseibium sp.]|uniref:alpha/beta hydrolase family protein n=1 Tax=Roseibium sp. TaxID=1936156 RepID=UPI003B502808
MPDPNTFAANALRTTTALLVFLLFLAGPPEATASSVLPYGPGVSELTVTDARTDRPLSGNVWYPTTTPEKYGRADKSKVWQMAEADPDGVAAEGTFPLLVISHGMYGNTLNQAWLGSALARRGFIVAMVNHPGTSTFLRDVDHARELWDRPVDLSRLITFLIERSALADRIDQSRVFAAGHSLGGYTVMLLAGARFDAGLYQSLCTGDNSNVVCPVLEGWSVAETDDDRREMEISRQDDRVARIVSMDLGGTPVLSRQSLGTVDKPVLVLGSGRADMLDQDIESRMLAALMPGASTRHVELADAGHFDFMGICKPEGYEILKEHEPGDEIVCIKGSAEREAQHGRIISELIDFFDSE